MYEECGCQGNVSILSSDHSVSETSTASSTPPPPQPLAERLSDTLQHGIQVVIGSHRKPPRLLKSLLM